MKLNQNGVMRKAAAYAKSAKGKRAMQGCVQEYAQDGVKKTAGGSAVQTQEQMEQAARKMIECLRKAARDFDLPLSVVRCFDTLYTSMVQQGDGTCVAYVSFDADNGLHRDSLMPERYDGIDNIVALLNNGYEENEKIGSVWGEWHGMRIHGLTGRTGLGFMQQAVNDFNETYGYRFHVTAQLSDEYR